MRNRRQHTIDRALARILEDASPYLMPEQALREEIASRVTPRPTTTELDDALRHADAERRLTSLAADTGPKHKLSDIGRAWLAENS